MRYQRTCAGCGNKKMGARAKFCNECGTKLPSSRYEPSIEELEDDERWKREFDGTCSPIGHAILAAAAETVRKIRYCPKCGKKI